MQDAQGVENAGAYCVPVWKYKKGEGRKGKEGMGEKGIVGGR